MNGDILNHAADGAIWTGTIGTQFPSQRKKQAQHLPEDHVYRGAVVIGNREIAGWGQTVFSERVCHPTSTPGDHDTGPDQPLVSDLFKQIALVLLNPAIPRKKTHEQCVLA